MAHIKFGSGQKTIPTDYAQAGGGSSLPSVTSADEGKVLAVNSSGEWAAESVMISYDSENDRILVTYNQLKNMMEHNKIPYYIRAIESDGVTEYGLYRLSSMYYTEGIYVAVFMTFSNNYDNISTHYYANSTADGYLSGD